MEVDIQELWNRLQVEQKYHQQLATAYQAVLNDLQRMLPPAEIKVKKGNAGKHFSEEHKRKLRESHALRKKKKQEEVEKARINAEQIRMLQPTQ